MQYQWSWGSDTWDSGSRVLGSLAVRLATLVVCGSCGVPHSCSFFLKKQRIQRCTVCRVGKAEHPGVLWGSWRHRVDKGFMAGPEMVVVVSGNKKQCSRQLQCKVPCAGNVINSSLFINSSLSSLSSTSHAVCRGGLAMGGFGYRGGRGGGRGRGRGHFIYLAMYCTTTWYFALKGLRTMKDFEQASFQLIQISH